ncbi:hypothetical protein [Oleiharenicola lentus]|uniref:hypothetical protein n=1 Tax=Oleiharenicola lentus TaxID=2508720 RepID=UPI003F666F5A
MNTYTVSWFYTSTGIYIRLTNWREISFRKVEPDLRAGLVRLALKGGRWLYLCDERGLDWQIADPENPPGGRVPPRNFLQLWFNAKKTPLLLRAAL